MPSQILFVDDDVNILSAFQRNLRRDFEITTASSPEAALMALENQSFSVIVSDIKMPRMSGVELLSLVAEKWPDTVRILLTGEADAKAAIGAINYGHVYRFLMKPLALTPLTRILTDAVKQHTSVVTERALLEKTLSGSMQVLTEVLCLLHPLAFSRSSQIRNIVREMLSGLQLEDTWELEMAAMVSLIGCIAVPNDILTRAWKGGELTESERHLFESHPVTGARLLASIPRFESICRMIELQEQILSPLVIDDIRKVDRVLLGAYLLKMANEFVSLSSLGLSRGEIIDRMQGSAQAYPPQLFALFARIEAVPLSRESRTIKFKQLAEGMVVQSDVLSDGGLLLLAKGHAISNTILEGLVRYSAACGIREPIQVLLPPEGLYFKPAR
jgi:FixJ family two-component response regulator